MRSQRVHIVGASGTGTTTLGRALADAWSVPHADVDDYYWLPTDPPYSTKRDRQVRLELMESMFIPRAAWVLSGSLVSWGEDLIRHFDSVVFVTLESSIRLARLRDREARRSGASIDAGGEPSGFLEFLEWAARYDDERFEGRSRVNHERWLATLPCPILRLDGAHPVEDLVATMLSWTP
jgi:adenylate kinase family enzyme